MIKLSFHGACREVTGSCNLLDHDGKKFLVDCGIFQGERFAAEKNLEDFHFNPAEVEFVFLTHAHVDHCGRLPKLYKDGFRGQVFCTEPTRDLVEIMLLDAARIIAHEAMASGHEALYTEDDVEGLMNHFETIPYDEMTFIDNNIQLKFRDAGHILGSAFVELYIKDEGREKKIVFSGDLGNSPSPIIRDLEFADGADYVITESTYAYGVHETKEEGIDKLRKAILETVGLGGVLMIPIFVIEKTQEILFELNYLMENRLIPRVPIFLDSPLAIKAVDIYRHYEDLYNRNSWNLIKSGDDIFDFPGLKFTLTKDESKKINVTQPPKVILASSGMCVGGRIPFHLKLNLDNKLNHVLFVAYQAQGTLGRKILDGDQTVFVDDRSVEVLAQVSVINSFSSHADYPRIMDWLRHIKGPKPTAIFVNHGEEKSSDILSQKISEELKVEAVVPELYMIYELK
ncbi:MAG: MBL fold metallo-hydrolase [Candidatus Falkowbacteria bacterium]